MVQWSLQTAEVTVTIAIDLSKPTIVLLDGPIHLIDEILCKSLDMVEEAVPIIKEEPDQVCVFLFIDYFNHRYEIRDIFF